MTEKLFRVDPYQRAFSARVVRRAQAGRRPAVELDRTLFYPTAGGQPNDTGVLNGVAVVDVVEDEATGAITHILAGELAADEVQGEIDWPRRVDHMQQHSGQHILSQACERILDAATVSFHLGGDLCTIDIQRTAMTAEEAAAVEDAANAIIFENRPLRVHLTDDAGLSAFPLRKPPTVSGEIRIVEVADFDYSPCGGTHVRSAGEIGLIKLRRWERRGETLRVDFLCGQRALLDYRWKNEAVLALANSLSIKDRDLLEGVQRTLAQGRENFRQLEDARQRLLALEARALLAETPERNGYRLVGLVLAGYSGEEARRLAMELTTQPGVYALFGVAAAERAGLIFARSAGLPLDMSALLKQALPLIQGRGGGTAGLAQGGGPGVDKLEEALAMARDYVVRGQ